MSIYSARRLKTKFGGTMAPDLPLGGLTFTTDPATNMASTTLNPDLPDMLGRLTQLSQAPCEKARLFNHAGRD